MVSAAASGGTRTLAILTALTLRLLFRLPLRQTEGFHDSLLSWRGLDLKASDHTTLSRRNQIVEVQPLTRAHDGPIALIVDSTGLKILGSGEWNIHKHKASKRRRAWRKLHIGVDEERFIVAAALTPGSMDDASTLCRICSARSRIPSGGSRPPGPTTTGPATIGLARPEQGMS